MQIVSSAWDVLGAFLIFVLGLILSYSLAGKFDVRRARSVFLYCWHTVFCFMYIRYVMAYGGDALMYYDTSSAVVEPGLGSTAVRFITSFFSVGMDLSILGSFLAFNTFGFVGLLAFDGSLKACSRGGSPGVRRLAKLIVLLPSVSFWSVAIGKDAISFAATGLALWACLSTSRRIWVFALSIALMTLVRPHIAAIMIASLSVAMAVNSKLTLPKKAFVVLLSMLAAGAIIPTALDYTGIGSNAGPSEVAEYVAQRQEQNLGGGSSLEISSMPFPVKLFTYLLRPLPYEASGITGMAAAFDNVVLLLLMAKGLLAMLNRRSFFLRGGAFLWIYSIVTWVVLAMTTANLGISVRQKWMFVPMLIALFIAAMASRRKTSSNSSYANSARA
jgi:hypothetical protein